MELTLPGFGTEASEADGGYDIAAVGATGSFFSAKSFPAFASGFTTGAGLSVAALGGGLGRSFDGPGEIGPGAGAGGGLGADRVVR